MVDKVSNMLAQAINDYMLWMTSSGYAQSTLALYQRVLNHFLDFINRKGIAWEALFTFDTLTAFEKESSLPYISAALKGLSQYLFQQKRIYLPLQKQHHPLPHVYKEYLRYYEKSRQVQPLQILRTRRVLSALNDYLERGKGNLNNISIEQLDIFLAEHSHHLAPKTRQNERSCLRGFLSYLYHERKLLKRDIAPMLVGAPLYAQSKPPKFLRPHEVKKLFSTLPTSSPKALRTFAMLHLGYTLGLRPKEISLIRLDDISFTQGEISLPERKSNNPIKLPLPEVTIKAVAAYIISARPKSDERALFLTFRAPYKPISPVSVSMDITASIRKAGLLGSAYWLRHTYAQNLLEDGASIYEIKEMLGHDKIQTTERYLHIHINLMREVILDETF